MEGEGDDLSGAGYAPLIEIRRSGKISNSLNSNEREHLESSVLNVVELIKYRKRSCYEIFVFVNEKEEEELKKL